MKGINNMKNEKAKDNLNEILKREKQIEQRENACNDCGSILQPNLDKCPSCASPSLAGFADSNTSVAGSPVIAPLAVPKLDTEEEEQ